LGGKLVGNILLSAVLATSVGILPPAAYLKEKAAAPAAASKRLVVSVGQTVPLQMSSKRPIKTVLNQDERIVRVKASPTDRTTVLVTGLMPGRTFITLIDADGKKEVCKIGR
jgi:hypothetical protein